ncbi:CHAT domain-containing protein [Allosaccharopolyspora coralli]|uniref:CHAT domain-containing protein n=1 Tax=Allosaccharopolyspora coralli TaxID=2665642 RepID=A0A5Q3QE94_9PSEU|nr:CHAT domain-containing protein [Allosaccharopolyspora coralli]QGK71544.1 CHAT domain-containing protein [Allosaccharopolyspora coralli]
MNDEVGRRGETAHRHHRQDTAGNSWFASPDAESDTGRDQSTSATPESTTGAQAPPAADPAPTQHRYAEALEALNRIVSTRDFQALPWVTQVLKATANTLHERDPARAGVLNNLGSAAQLAFLASGSPEDLEDATYHYRAAASAARERDPDRVLYLSNLSLALTDRAFRERRADLAADAVDSGRRAVDLTADNDPRRPTALVRLAHSLKLHATLADDVASGDEAISAFRSAARSFFSGDTGSVSAESSDLLTHLGATLLTRYRRTGTPEDIDEAIQHLDRGVGGLADGSARREAVHELATALRLRFRLRGDLADLDESATEFIGIVGVLHPEHPMLGKVLLGLARTAGEHVDSTGEPSGLRRCLRALSPAIRAVATHDPDRPAALAAFGALMRRLFLHGADANAIDTAVAAGESATRAGGAPEVRCAVRTALATTLVARYEHNDGSADLDRAAEVANEAAELAEEGSPAEYRARIQLGLVASHRYRQSGSTADLDEAVNTFDEVMVRMPRSSSERALVAAHLGQALQASHQHTGKRRTYRWARRVLAEGSDQYTAPADHRLRAATLAGRLAAQAQRWPEAVESFRSAVDLLPVVSRGKQAVAPPRTQQRWATMLADAAACAMEDGSAEHALELLEHGRSAIFADVAPAAGELGELHRVAPELADEAVRVRRLLDRPPEEDVLAGPPVPAEDGRRKRLAAAWEQLLDEIRAMDGQQEHLRRTPIERLRAVGESGPVVVVNVSRYRSDAFVVFGGRVLPVALPGANHETLAGWAASLLDESRPDEIGRTLEGLWHTVTRPVLDRMGYRHQVADGGRWPRVWWCTFGAAALLPLHAATAENGDSALDRVLSSYTPTLGTLLRAREQAQRPPVGSGLVAAGSLRQAARVQGLPAQNQVLARSWPEAELMGQEDTTPHDLLEAIPAHSWLHVCERSTHFPAHPAASLLLDRGEQPSLGLVELGQMALQHAQFCYLGAAATAAQTPTSASVTLPGSLAAAGFAHVVGSLWQLDADCAEQVQADVYATLTADSAFSPQRSAEALHHAARTQRAASPEAPTRWAGHLHLGP